jgi:hypothetical protein
LKGAALAVLACGSAAWATDQTAAVPGQVDAANTPSVYTLDTAGPTTLTPVMYWLSNTSFGKWMTDNNISIQGFVEGGYFYDTNNPRLGSNATGDSPTDIAFPGGFSNRGLLDQADLLIQKTVDTSKVHWDWGIQVEQGYGTDDAQIHSDGLLDNRGYAAGVARTNDPQNQYDIVQANASLLVPLGSGLTITAGKFVTFPSEEVISSPSNYFFTHSYNFTYGVPATNTGIYGAYTFAKAVNGQDLTVKAGITRGWNQSLRDNNGAIDFMGQASGKWNDKLSWTFNTTVGPEQTGNDSNYRTLLEFIPSYSFSDQLTGLVDLLYVDDPHGSAVDPGQSAQWYSVAPYLSYKVNSYFTVNARAEYYRDQGGASVGAGYSANFYALTVGTTIHPFPTSDVLQWLELRPEARYDLSDRPVFNAAHSSALSGTGDYNEFTVAMDVIMQF